MTVNDAKTHSRGFMCRLLETLMMLGMAASMSCIVCTAFHVSPLLQFNLAALLLVPLVYLVLMQAFTRSRLFALVGAVVLLLITAAAVAIVSSAAGATQALQDADTNPGLFIAVLAVVTAAVFLLSRSFPGSIALFVVGGITAAFVQFLYNWNLVACTLIFIALAVAMIVFKYYLRSYSQTAAGEAARYGSAFATGLVAGIVLVALGAGLFFCINALAHPQALQLKPFKEYFALEQVDIKGIANSTSVDNENRTSSNTDDGKVNDGAGGKNDSDKDQNDNDTGAAPSEGSMMTYTQEALEDAFDVISYSMGDWWKYWIAPILILFVLVPIVVKKFLRMRWHNAVRDKDPRCQVMDFYLFFIDRFERLGIGKPQSTTALSFGANHDPELVVFEENGGITIEEMSRIYTACAYGHDSCQQEDADRFEGFYATFYKSCRSYVGGFKYLFMFFRL